MSGSPRNQLRRTFARDSLLVNGVVSIKGAPGPRDWLAGGIRLARQRAELDALLTIYIVLSARGYEQEIVLIEYLPTLASSHHGLRMSNDPTKSSLNLARCNSAPG